MSINKQELNPISHQNKLERFKKALENDTYTINSDYIASALLEARRWIKPKKSSIKMAELI